MLYRSLNIRGWWCFFYFAIHSYWIDEILLRMSDIGAPPFILSNARIKMREDRMDTGFTFSNPTMRTSVVVLGRQSSGAEFLNSFTHELRHLTDDIATAYDYPIRGEEVAYLAGDIALKLSDIVCQQSCFECRL